MLKSVLTATALCALGVIAGCGGREDLAPATGVVTFKGEPVADAKIMLHPLDGGPRNSYGTTNAKGEFKLSTFGLNDGALLGRHAVTVSKTDVSALPQFNKDELATKGYQGASYEAMMGPGMVEKNQKKVKNIIPAKYSTKENSGIEIDVVKGETNHFPLDLTE